MPLQCLTGPGCEHMGTLPARALWGGPANEGGWPAGAGGPGDLEFVFEVPEGLSGIDGRSAPVMLAGFRFWGKRAWPVMAIGVRRMVTAEHTIPAPYVKPMG